MRDKSREGHGTIFGSFRLRFLIPEIHETKARFLHIFHEFTDTFAKIALQGDPEDLSYERHTLLRYTT